MCQIPSRFKPVSRYILHKKDLKNLPQFPFIVKPDLGERGINVELIQTLEDWANYPLNKNLIIQEYLDFSHEFGVFYAKLPQKEKGEILSITGKEFLTYTADGKSTLQEFISQNPRTQNRIDYLKERFISEWEIILPKGTVLYLEPIGNHNRGTRFFDASHLISEELTHVLNEISQNIKGFNYGRFDVKANSEEDLKKGNLKIIEINGANSEPTHIYDSKYTLIQAYREVKRHLDIQYEIAIKQPRNHSSTAFYKAVIKRVFS